MASEWKAGLEDLEDQGLGPSAANPLAALGIDPDVVRANPEMLAGLNGGGGHSGSSPAATPASAPTMNSTPTSSSADATPDENTPYSLAISGLKNLQKTQGMANQAAEEVPTTDPEIPKLTAQRSKLAAPVDLYDSATGKMKDKVQVYNPETGNMDTVAPKPSTGRRIWRGVRGGLVGLLTGGIPGAALGALDPSMLGQAGYGSPTDAYQRTQQRNAQALDATDTGIKNEFSNWKNMVDAAKAKSTELRTNATIGKDQVTGAKDVISAQAQQSQAETAAAAARNETPEQKRADEQAQFETRGKRADAMKLSPLNKTLYILNGKVPDPREPNAAEIDAASAARALAVFKASHGGQGPQTLEDYNAIQASARGTLKGAAGGGPTDVQVNQMNDRKNKAIADANKEFAKQPYGANARTAYQRALQQAQNAFEQDASQFGVGGPHMEVTVDEHGQAQWTPTAAPAPAAAPAAAATPQVEAPPGATAEVLDPQGKLAGHVVNGKFVPLKKAK